MEKLIELLQLQDQLRCDLNDERCLVREEGVVKKLNIDLIISKHYQFIKWLVENDKIDRDIMEGKKYYFYLEKSENMHGDKNFSRYERLLMLLAIQDEPIEFLISILK